MPRKWIHEIAKIALGDALPPAALLALERETFFVGPRSKLPDGFRGRVAGVLEERVRLEDKRTGIEDVACHRIPKAKANARMRI